MAYAFIVLAESLEQKQVGRTETKVPSVVELRHQARELLKRAIQIKPNYLNARLFLAILSYDEGNYPNALQEVNNALSIEATHPTALRRKGFILEKLGESDEALEVLDQAKQRLQDTQKNGENEHWIQEVDEKVAELKKRKSKRPKKN